VMTANSCADTGAGNINKHRSTIARIGLSYNFGVRLSKVSLLVRQWDRNDPLSDQESLH
jgi:hypothetical protein